jgi:hypothetical protein
VPFSNLLLFSFFVISQVTGAEGAYRLRKVWFSVGRRPPHRCIWRETVEELSRIAHTPRTCRKKRKTNNKKVISIMNKNKTKHETRLTQAGTKRCVRTGRRGTALSDGVV